MGEVIQVWVGGSVAKGEVGRGRVWVVGQEAH